MPELTVEIYDRANNSFGDITTYCQTIGYTKRLNRPATGRFRVPTKIVPFLQAGRCAAKFRLDGNVQVNGIVWFVDHDGDERSMYTEALVVDPMIWWRYRFARDLDGDLSLPHFMTDFQSGAQIIPNLVRHSFIWDGQLGLDFLSGTFEEGGVDISGAPVEWPMMIGDIAALAIDTGTTDCVIRPVDDNDGYEPYVMGVLDTYNGRYGADITGSADFRYAFESDNNVARMKRTFDMNSICNSLWYWYAPKVSIQRWRGNTTYPAGVGAGEGGPPIPGGNVGSTEFQVNLNAAILDSRAAMGKFMDQRTYDTSLDFRLPDLKKLYGPLWETESLLRLNPRELITFSPMRGIAPTFDIGNIISVSAGPDFGGGFAANQRVYEYSVEQPAHEPCSIVDVTTSADQESDV